MPSSKLSTSIDQTYKAILREKAAEGAYQFLLDELLAVIHRDGGHYTVLTGHDVSVADAMDLVLRLRHENRELHGELRRLRKT